MKYKTYMSLKDFLKRLNCFKKIETPIFVKEPKNQIMKFKVVEKDCKEIEVLMENVHLSDFTIRKICSKDTQEPNLVLKKVGYLPDTFWEEYKNVLFIINNDNYFTLINKHTALLFENRYTIIF